MPKLQQKIIVFVIALILSAQAEATCSSDHEKYIQARDAISDDFEKLIKGVVDNSSIDITPFTNEINTLLPNILQDGYKYCKNATDIGDHSFGTFENLVVFTLLNARLLRDLESIDEFQCVGNQRMDLRNCFSEYANENGTLHNNYLRSFAESDCDCSPTCFQTNLTKTCVLQVLEQNKCNSSMEYVNTLFDYVWDNYCTRNKFNVAKDEATCSSDHEKYVQAVNAITDAFETWTRAAAVDNSSIESITEFKSDLNTFLPNILQDGYKYCKNATDIGDHSFGAFMNLAFFPTPIETVFKDLENTGAVQCFRKQQTRISNCIANENATSVHFAKSDRHFSPSCVQTNLTNTCIVQALEQNNCSIVKDFFNSIFKYVWDNYCTTPAPN